MIAFNAFDILRMALAVMVIELGLALLPGRSRLNPAVDQITRGLDHVSDELRKDQP